MRYEIVTDEEWVDRIVGFDEALDARWICDVFAVSAGSHMHPKGDAISLYLTGSRFTVIVALDDNDELQGYLIGADDRGGSRGGGRGRWISAESPIVIEGLVKKFAKTYGWAWGRITNRLIQQTLLDFGCQPLRDDPTIFTYGRP